jgi:hypothetical protein
MPRHFQFSLLDMMVLTLAVAVVLVPVTMFLRRDTTNDAMNKWVWEQAILHEKHHSPPIPPNFPFDQ